MRKQILSDPDEKFTNFLVDTGCDILMKKDNQFYIVQCKNYSENSVRIENLAGFYAMVAHHQLPGIVYYTSRLSIHLQGLRKNPAISFVNLPLGNTNHLEIPEVISNDFVKKESLIEKAFDYQKDAYEACFSVLKEGKRTILHLPCGMGKTLISMMVSKNFPQIVIVSPLKQYCIQNLSRYISDASFAEYSHLLIDSDGTRNVSEIEKFIESNKKFIFSVTYKSCDVLVEIIEKLENFVVIFDEFHNISKNDVSGENNSGIYQLLVSESKIMFMSATPRIFELEDEELNSEIFGEIDYSFPFGKAIESKYICDYKVFIPDIKLDNKPFTDAIQQEVSVEKFDNSLLTKANFLIRGMLETGGRKSIVYAKSQKDSFELKSIIKNLEEYFAIPIYVETILSVDSREERTSKLKTFSSFDGFGFLISVEILNECIDIPVCDTIFITYPSESKIRNIQRICRANRKNSMDYNKYARIFLWADEYDDCFDVFSHLKEFDSSFCIDKVAIFQIKNEGNLVLSRKEHPKTYEVLDRFLMGIKQILTWDERFDLLKKHILENGKPPSPNNSDPLIHILGVFWQKQNYNYEKKIKMMRHQRYYDIWTVFKNEFSDYYTSNKTEWILKFNELKNFIKVNNRSPNKYSKDENEQRIGGWIQAQKVNLKSGTKMLAHSWAQDMITNFLEEYKQYFLTFDDKWIKNFTDLETFLEKNHKVPSVHNEDEKKLSVWQTTQKKNYKKQAQIMSIPEYREKWDELRNTYPNELLSKEELWFYHHDRVSQFILEHKRRPNKHSLNEDEKFFGNWLGHNLQNYNLKKNNMTNEEIRTTYESFTQRFQDHLNG